MAGYSSSRWDQFSEDSGKESLPHSDSDSDVNPEQAGPSKTDRKALFFCDICEVECSSIDALQKHFAGTKHQKKLGLNGLSSNLKAKYEMRESDELSGKIVACTLCKVVFHGLERAIHFKSEKHRALSNFANESVKVEHNQFLEIIADAPADCMEGEIDIDVPEEVKDGFRCMLCDATLTTRTLFQAHIEGKKHQKKARWHYLCKEGESLEVNQYWCRLCNTFCTDRDALTAHYRGKNHIKILQKKGWIKGDEDVDSKPTDSRGKIRIKEEPMNNSDESEYQVDLAKVKVEPGLKFHSSERSKKRSYRNSRSETPSSESEYSLSPSPPPVRKKKNRSHSPSARKRRISSRSPPHKRKHCSPSPPPARKRKDRSISPPSAYKRKNRSLSPPSAYKRKDHSPSPPPAQKRKGRSPSPPPKRRVSLPSAYKRKGHSRSPSSSPVRRRKSSSGRKKSPSHSPVQKKKNHSPSPVYSSSPSPSPIRRRKSSSGRKKSPSCSSVRKKKDRSPSPSPVRRRKSSSGRKQSPSSSPIRKKKNRSPSPVHRRKSHKEESRSPSESSSRSRSDSRTRNSKQIQQSNHDGKKRKRSYSHERKQSRTSPPRKRARTNSNRSRSRERWRSKSPPARRNSAKSKRGRSARGSSSSQSRSRWRSTDDHSDTTQDSQSTLSSRGRGRFRPGSVFTEHDDRNVTQYVYSSGSRSPSPLMENRRRRPSSSGMWKRGGWRQERSRFFRDRRDSRHFVKTEQAPEPVSSGEDHDELHFEGFSQDLSSDDSGAPPISSLSVSYILHALRKSCQKN